MAHPVVAVVGRPNVGKSTLINRMVGRRAAIVEEQPGVTRDRKELDAEWGGRKFRIVDTGGWVASGSELDRKVSAQSERAMTEADVVVFVVDVTTGLTEEDSAAADVLRRARKPVVLVANKVDDTSHEPAIWEAVGLGLGDPLPVSALHGRGSGDLLDRIVQELDSTVRASHDSEEQTQTGATDSEAEADADLVSIAIVGRPNVGKSTLFNRLIGEDRSVVHDLPGTTRDTVDTVVETDLGRLRFVDTAGMRRRAKQSEGPEYYSLVRALQAVDASDVALLVIDATEGVTGQDQRLAERVDASGCPIVLVLNKWELLDTEERAALRNDVTQRLSFVGEAPVLPISALSGKGVHKLLPALGISIDAYRRRIPTHKVNAAIQAAQQSQPAPGGARILYALQGATNPPTFTLFANRELPRSYIRYVERKLREAFDLGATPLKLRVRRRAS